MSAEYPDLTPEELEKFSDFVSAATSDNAFVNNFVNRLIHNEAAVDAIKRVARQSRDQVGYSDKVAGLVERLAARSGESRKDVLLKALNLYGLALDAVEDGNSLVIANPEDEIVREITGFQPLEAAKRPVAR